MISQKAQAERLVRNNGIMVAYVDSHDTRYKDPFIEMVSKNIAEFNTLDLRQLEQKVITTTSYLDALHIAQRQGCKHLLYVELGTVIDWCDGPMKDIVAFIRSYPDSKFFGHILQHANGSFYIHPQFFIIDVEWAMENNIRRIEEENPKIKWNAPVFERSVSHFHDGYTPHWVKIGEKKRFKVRGQGKGWNILDAIFETDSEMQVWPEHIRNAKKFLYPTVKEECVKNKAVIFSEMNTNRVYVANTEEIQYEKYARILDHHDIKCVATPASGLSTFLLPFYARAEKTLAYDINIMSLHMIELMTEEWDGTNFKDFINTRVVTHRALESVYKAKDVHLENADALLKSFGDEWVDWWRTRGKNSITTKQIDIFNHHTWYNFKNHLMGNHVTLLNISNIMHYAPSATLFNTQQRIDILKNLHSYITTNVMNKENLLIHGRSPTESDHPIYGYFRERDIVSNIVFPWRKN